MLELVAATEVIDRCLGAGNLGSAQPKLWPPGTIGVALAESALFRIQSPCQSLARVARSRESPCA